MRRMSAFVGALWALAGWLHAAEPIETRGAIDSVTLYRGQALVTRVIEVPSEGLREVIVQELPEHVVPESLYAEASGGEVRSVRYRVRPQAEDVREEVRALDEKLRAVEDRVMRVARQKQVNAEYKAFLANLEQFASSSTTSDLHRGLLNADTLKTMALFLLEQRSRLAEEELQLSFEHRTLQEESEVLQRQRQVLTGSSAKTAREAVVFLNVTAKDSATMRLRYLVNGATWTPSYTVRAGEPRSEVTLEYYALIQQMSGEDWNDVNMVLSTATPSLVAKAPEITPLAVTLTSADAAASIRRQREELMDEKKELLRARNQAGQMQQRQQMAPRAAAGSKGDHHGNAFEEFDARLNALANEELLDDILTQGRVHRSKGKAAPQSQEGPTVTYTLASRTVLPSRADQQQVQIASMKLPGEFYLIATPVLTNYVYEEATVRNSSKLVLLAGPSSMYLEGQFVGHGEIPTVTTGEEFTVGLGIEPSLRASRELLERNDSVQGGNRLVEFVYAISIENFGEAPKNLRVMDRIPTGRDSDIKVSLISSQVQVHQESDTQSSERKKGILRWDIDVPAGAIGVKAESFEYRFKLEYDKGMSVAGLALSTS